MQAPLFNIDYQVVYINYGRIRIKIPLLRYDPEYTAKLKQLVEPLEFVTNIRINPAASSLVINYDRNAISEHAILEELFSCIEQALTKDTSAIAQPSTLDPGLDNEDKQEFEYIFPPSISTEFPQSDLIEPYDNSKKAEVNLKQGELAKRLGVTTQAITHHRSKPDFGEWSQRQDPEGIAWCYDSASKSFFHREPR